MSIQLNKKAYEQLIKEDIDELNKYMPGHSLCKNHIIDILKWSVNQIYKPQPQVKQDSEK